MSRLTHALHRAIFGFLTRTAWFLLLIIFAVGAVVASVNYVFGQGDPLLGSDTSTQTLTVPSGASLQSIASQLAEAGLIGSATAFRIQAKLTGVESDLKAGTYYLSDSLSAFNILKRLSQGDYRIPQVRVTLIEGEPLFEYAQQLDAALDNFDSQEFMSLIDGKEGFMFPDTYQFPENADAEYVIDALESNFERRLLLLMPAIESSPYTLEQIITMASLVETEADRNYETKQRVAGVLWKRLSIGMPLQADAVFSYIFGQHLPRVLFRHLEVDSPYNIYKNTGLPPGPIGNPGLASIRATLDPIITNDLYYLTGSDGRFYYAQTLGQHERNRRLHIRY